MNFFKKPITIIWLTLLSLLFLYYVVFSVKIPVSYQGIKVNLYWDEQGVSIYTLDTWRNLYNPITSDVYKYPVFVQQEVYNWITFQDVDWLVITANIGMDYKFQDTSVAKIFEEYRVGPSTLTNQYMPTWLKNSINRASAKFKVDELYWPKKEEFRLAILENIKEDFDEKGIVVNNIYFVWDMELPNQVMSRITAKIEATQNAMQKENELRAVEAEAQKKIAEAKGYNEAKIIKAQADAEAIRIQAEAIRNQWGAEYVQLKAIEQWDGKLPVTTLWDSVPMLQLK